MSAIRVCRNGVWQWEKADDGAVGRISHSRYGVKGGGPPIVKYRPGVSRAAVAHLQTNPDNGAVEASITEVQR